VGSAACGLVVPDTLPAFSCLPGAETCPDGQVCAPETHQCVPSSLDGGPGLPDAGVGTFVGCSTLGCRCSGPSDCASGVCGDLLTVRKSLYAAAGNTSFCTKPCCTSTDCDESTVCFAGASGGSYCARPEWLGRGAKPGAGLGGAPCGSDGDCRSALCAGSACADPCCSTAQSASQCAANTACTFGTFPGRTFDALYTAYCAVPPGAASNGAACSTDARCRSGLCTLNRCHDACRNSSDCGAPSEECGYALPSLSAGVIVSACSASPGTGAQGAPCQGNQGCQSGFCSALSMSCTDVCYADSDCTARGWRCRPEVLTFPGGGNYSVLACGS
jgi:hypothetical protein